jgi:hypothetical protein
MLMSPVGLKPKKGSAGDAQQKLKTTDPLVRVGRRKVGRGSQRGA